MLSIQLLREHPDDVRRALARRHTEAPLDEALALDAQWRGVLAEVEPLRSERNTTSKEIGEALDIIDFERGTKLSGGRFVVLKGSGARLARALIAWMLDHHIANGYLEIYPPAMLREENFWAGGWLPKFRENLFHDAEEDYWLLPTAEVALTNLHRDEVLDVSVLPPNYVAYSPCFRREKASAGRGVRRLERGRQLGRVGSL